MGESLATLIEEVQYELNQAASPAVGQQFREHIKNRIRREYRRLYHDFDWPHLQERVTTTTQAGERYYDYPNGVILEQVQEVWRRWGTQWARVDRGVDYLDYNYFDSESGIRMDPIMKWRPYGTSQIEVWPIPATNVAAGLAWVVKRAFIPLVDEDDLCDLDTDLVVLHAAAELARRFDNDDAQLLLARAAQHFATLRARSQRGGIKVDFTRGPDDHGRRRERAPIVVAAAGSASASTDNISISVFITGSPSSSELVLLQAAARDFTATTGLCSAEAETAATADTVFTITVDGDAFATVTFSAGQTEGVFAFSGTAVADDAVIRFIAPASVDATLADISITLGGVAA